MRFKLITIVLLVISFATKAQTQDDRFVQDLIESLAENLPEDFDLSELQDRLLFYKKRPINLNKTTTEELNSLIFLSPLQISNLFTHLEKNGNLIDVLELQSIPNFDIETVQRLLPFVTLDQTDLVDKITWRNLRVLADNDLVIRMARLLEKPKGFTDLPGSRYLGSQERFLWRYKYNYSNRVSASLIFEKDAGEYFFKGDRQFIFDFQTAHIAVYNTGRFKKIVVGDYSLQFGQGLHFGQDFLSEKRQMLHRLQRKILD